MTSRAKIGQPLKSSATLRIPYAGALSTVAELRAIDAALTPEDYGAVRLALGGGKRGRDKARELVPLACPSCGCRLVHFERTGRAPYFAAAPGASEHGPHCDASVTRAPTLALVHTPHAEPPPRAEPPLAEPTHYIIGDEATSATTEPSCRLAHAHDLLVLALNRAVTPGSQVWFRGERFTLVAASDVQHLADGEAVAMYGRLCEAEWNPAYGRLTLRAVPRTAQVWATGSLPRIVLQLERERPMLVPKLHKPVPFLVFGKLKKLADVCGVPAVQREYFVPLQPLAAPHASAAATDDPELTRELDELLSQPPPADDAELAAAD